MAKEPRISPPITNGEMLDQDRGQGDQNKFAVEDLERLYKQSGLNAAQMQGNSLNQILGVTTYEPDAMYIVTAQGVEKL